MAQIKELRCLELSDDKNGINNLLKETLKGESISFYVDYRDYEGIECELVKCKTREDFENMIWECYLDCEAEMVSDLVKEVSDKIRKHYEDKFDDLSYDLEEYIREYIQDNVPVEYPFDDYYRYVIRVNLFINYGHSNDAWDREYDRKTVAKVLEKLGYVHPNTILKELEHHGYTGEDKFLLSLQNEIFNMYIEQVNELCFVGNITIDEYFKILENPKGTRITLTDQHTGGFVDRHNGGGSILDLTLPVGKPLTIKGMNVSRMLVEKSGDKYTVDDIYGLTSNCFKRIEVK